MTDWTSFSQPPISENDILPDKDLIQQAIYSEKDLAKINESKIIEAVVAHLKASLGALENPVIANICLDVMSQPGNRSLVITISETLK